MSRNARKIKIRELNPEEIIRPNSRNWRDVATLEKGGLVTALIGQRGTGKSRIIRSLIYEKSHVFPTGEVISETEDSNHFYSKFFPGICIHNKLEKDMSQIKNFIRRQKIAKEYLENPWSILLLDDCMSDPKIFNDKTFQELIKNGRHFATWVIIAMQFSLDLKPNIRNNIDGVFVFRDPNIRNRRKTWENYAGIIPDFNLFCSIMDQITEEYTALYIHNASTSNKLEDCVFWYRAKPVPENFRFGCDEMWEFHDKRYNQNYRDIY